MEKPDKNPHTEVYKCAILTKLDNCCRMNLANHLKLETGNPRAPSPEPPAPSPQPTAPSPQPRARLPLSPPYRPKNGPDRYLTRKNRCNLYLTDALGSQIVEILTLRVQYVTTLLRNRRNPQLTRSLLISARAKKVVPARLLNFGR